MPVRNDLAFPHASEEPVLEDLLRPQALPSVHEVHLRGQIRKVQGLFHGSVAAPNDGHGLMPIEEAIAGGAGGHALTLKSVLRGEAQIASRGASGNDQSTAVALTISGRRKGRSLKSTAVM